MRITSASQIIDASAICNGCTTIDYAAMAFTKCASSIRVAASICTAQALSVENKTMQPTIEDLAQSVGKLEPKVREYTQQIRSTAQTLRRQQEEALREYQEEQKRKEERRRAAARKASKRR